MILTVSASAVCFAGCSFLPEISPEQTAANGTAVPGTSEPETSEPSIPANTPESSPSETPAQETQYATATPESTVSVTDDPATPEVTPEPTPVFPVNEFNISSNEEAASGYIQLMQEPEKEILTGEGIRAVNRKMIENCQAICNILEIPDVVDGKTLKSMAKDVSVPAQPLYDRSGNEIDEDRLDEIISNIGNIDENDTYPAVPGIIVRRSDLKRLPTELEFHASAGSALDLIQDTELYLGMPVWVLLGSEDGRFLFVQSYYYSGWTEAGNVAFPGSREEWMRFADPADFITVIDAKLDISGEQADMGVKLPYIDIDPSGEYYIAERPVRNEDGSLGTEQVKLSVKSVHRGYLKYTYANFLAQAFKYEGTMYQWGGINGGIDCSSFIASVMRPFGFYLARDTKDQNYSAGSGVDISGMSGDQVRQAIISAGAEAPVAIYTKGHVRFYIGEKDGKLMTIHAPGSYKLVTAEPFEKFDAVISVRQFCG